MPSPVRNSSAEPSWSVLQRHRLFQFTGNSGRPIHRLLEPPAVGIKVDRGDVRKQRRQPGSNTSLAFYCILSIVIYMTTSLFKQSTLDEGGGRLQTFSTGGCVPTGGAIWPPESQELGSPIGTCSLSGLLLSPTDLTHCHPTLYYSSCAILPRHEFSFHYKSALQGFT